MKFIKYSIALTVLVVGCGSSGVIDDGGTDAQDELAIDAAVDAPIDAQLGAPITGLTPGTWTWVPFAGAQCRDGTTTGIGVSPSASGSTKVMIFLEGGGACFNATTCGSNPAHFDSLTFVNQFVNIESLLGIFARNDATNAVADWNMVYVPYCTGDVHAGSVPNATLAGVIGPQQFVGYTNMTQYLSRIVPTFPGATRVLLTGQSAGGFGAALNYAQAARTFGSVPIDLLDDSGPLMGNPYLAPCLEMQLTALWGLSQTVVGADCGGDCTDPGNDLLLYWEHLPKTYTNVRFGFVDSVNDSVISSFFGYGANNCTAFVPVSKTDYEAAVLDMRAKVQSYPNVGSFLFPGGSHTSLVSAYTTRVAAGLDGGTVKLEDWTSALVGGTVTNVGP